MSKKIWGFFWIATIFLLFFCNGSLFITDSVESNYALTAKEMLQTNDWISPKIYGNYWYDKPIMFYWLTALSYKIFGLNEFASRFFPALFGLFAVILIVWAGKKLYSEKAGFYSGIILVTTIEFFLISKSVITDSILFFFFSSALLFFYLGYKDQKKYYYYGTYIFCALATLTKGPIGLLLPGLIIFLFLLIEKNWSELKNINFISGTIIFTVITLPWYLIMYSLHGSAFIDVFFGTHNFLRATVSEHPKDNVFYYYTLITLLAFFPWVGFLPQTIRNLIYQNKKWTRPANKEMFLIIWILAIFIFFQCIATKYITYTYPLIFPLSLLVGSYIAKQEKNLSLSLPLLYNLSFYLTLVCIIFWLDRTKKIDILYEWSMLIIVIIGISIGIYYYIKNNQKIVITTIVVTAFVFNLGLIYNVFLPFMQTTSAKELALVLEENFPDKNTIAIYGNYPTSAVFYSQKKIVKLIHQEEVESFKPKAYHWSSKNIMPYITFEEFIKTSDSIIALKTHELIRFSNDSNLIWQFLEKTNNWYILKNTLY